MYLNTQIDIESLFGPQSEPGEDPGKGEKAYLLPPTTVGFLFPPVLK